MLDTLTVAEIPYKSSLQNLLLHLHINLFSNSIIIGLIQDFNISIFGFLLS